MSASIADTPFATVADCIRRHAQARPLAPALADDERERNYAELDALMDRIAVALQRDGIAPGECIATCAAPSVMQAALFLGALRAGVVVAPLAPGSTPAALARMREDAQAKRLFADDDLAHLDAWLAPPGARPTPVEIRPESPFNIIYSSGTTGEPKGIVQPHGMRWAHVKRGLPYGYGPQAVTLLATPLYSNTTLVVFFPSLAFGGAVVLMKKFDARRYLEIAQARRATHTMLVPVQYQRLMAVPDFEAFDLSAFRMKFCTSAPFSAALKADVLKRWPGGLVEFYGMTEGGGTCILEAHAHPSKLHTVGRPAPGTDMRLIDEAGRELPPGSTGEVVGHSPGMMVGYHRRPEATREAEWFDASGKRFIRTGDIGRFDEDGFLILLDRRKDMIISGGFNIYPSDLEAALREHPAVAEAAVVGVPSEQWGETPVAFVVRRDGHAGHVDQAEALRQWLNARVGKTQRLAALHLVDELPRSAIGKVLKRELKELAQTPTSSKSR
ncbi:MAG: acyl--CoA ligase [Proteobacteria bacterium]|nr:acyl--CoA ligase [Pseudomonadota bacterium]